MIKVSKQKKTGQLGLPQKGQKQVYDLQRNALTRLIHFVQLHNKVNYCRDVNALSWRSTPCFCSLCGSPNYPVSVQNLFHYLYNPY